MSKPSTKAASAKAPARFKIRQGGKGKVTVVLEERTDRPGQLQLRYPETSARGAPMRRWTLCPPFPVVLPRDAAGRPDQCIEAELTQLVGAVRACILRGDEVKTMLTGAAPLAPGTAQPGSILMPATLTARPIQFRELVELAMPDPDVAGEPTGALKGRIDRARTLRQYALRAADTLQRMRGRTIGWEHLDAELWDELAKMLRREFASSPKAKDGVRAAEMAIYALRVCGRWLLKKEQITIFREPAEDWKRQLHGKAEVEESDGVGADRPRHAAPELGRMLRIVFDRGSQIDARLRLMLILGLELRLGQVCRLRRKRLDLDSAGAFGHGILRLPKVGKKHAPKLHLTAMDRGAIEVAFRTYLRDFEADYQAGKITDYLLFPGREMRTGVARPVRYEERVELSRRTIADHFQALERIAGVVPGAGRGPYGARRCAADEAPVLTSDQDLLDLLQGWVPKGLRNSIYRDQDNLRVGRKHGALRVALRAHLLACAESSPDAPHIDSVRIPSTAGELVSDGWV